MNQITDPPLQEDVDDDGKKHIFLPLYGFRFTTSDVVHFECQVRPCFTDCSTVSVRFTASACSAQLGSAAHLKNIMYVIENNTTACNGTLTCGQTVTDGTSLEIVGEPKTSALICNKTSGLGCATYVENRTVVGLKTNLSMYEVNGTVEIISEGLDHLLASNGNASDSNATAEDNTMIENASTGRSENVTCNDTVAGCSTSVDKEKIEITFSIVNTTVSHTSEFIARSSRVSVGGGITRSQTGFSMVDDLIIVVVLAFAALCLVGVVIVCKLSK